MINGISFDKEIENFMTQTVIIQTKSVTVAEGEEVTSWETKSTTKGLFVQTPPTGFSEVQNFYRNDVDISGKIYIPYDTDIDRTTDRLKIGSEAYYIVEVHNPLSSNDFYYCWVTQNA